MNFKANYEAIPLSTSSNFEFKESGVATGSTIHQIVCLTSGTAEITALGGGTFTWTAAANDKIDVLVSKITISSGTFIGFKTKFFKQQGSPFYNI